MLNVVHQWIRLNKIYKKMGKLLFKFQIRFLINGRKLNNIQTNSEARILLQFHSVIYQWIRLNKLYKLMESFLQNSESFFELTTVFWNNSGAGFMKAKWGGGGKAFVLISTRSSLLF